MRKVCFLPWLLFLALLWTSCSPAPTPRASTPTSLPPTKANTTILSADAMIQPGFRYQDQPGDMEVSFLDVVEFQAAVDEESETLEVVLWMRDIPPSAPLGQVKNFLEYLWMVSIYLDPARGTSGEPDYYLAVNTTIDDPQASRDRPIPGTPANVPIEQLFENISLNSTSGRPVSEPVVTADPDLDTLTLRTRVPRITAKAVFSFVMQYAEQTTDRPDNYATPQPTHVAVATEPGNTQTPNAVDQLVPAGIVRAYPGPEHYAGDVLTFEIANEGVFGDATIDVIMTLDSGPPTQISATSSWMGLVLPLALDTAHLNGQHTVTFTTADGQMNETYSFDVLPAEERPTQETRAEWTTRQTDCCVFHYIAETAAARDIGLIAEHFQQGAEDFEVITQREVDTKFNVYIIDTMWGNGGFGGNGELVISYTDRYYGPTTDGAGLELLARHEFTHAANIGLAGTGGGVDFNYEGLAVYIAGGHYKPEPLAERGAALYQLGHYVPVGQYLMQHELAYLYPAAMLTYIEEAYGKDAMWTFLGSDDNLGDDQPGSLEAAVRSVFGISLEEFDQAFQAWLEAQDPGEQLDDLRLTIELQDLRRQYQNMYVPPANFLLDQAVDAAARPEYLSVVIREAREPATIAVELLIAHGQQTIVDGDYQKAEEINKILADVLKDGNLDHPVAKEYLDIVLAASEAGYEVVDLNIEADGAEARVTAQPPDLIDMRFQKINGTWQIQP